MHGSAGPEFDMCCRGTEGPWCQLSTLQVSVGCVLGDLCVFDSTLFLYLLGVVCAFASYIFFFLSTFPLFCSSIPSFIFLFIFLCVFELSSANENVLAHWSVFFFAVHCNFKPLISCQLMFSCFFYLAVLSIIHTKRPLLLAHKEIWGKRGRAMAAGQQLL